MKKLLLLIATAFVLAAGFTVVLAALYVATETSVPPADDIAVPSGVAQRGVSVPLGDAGRNRFPTGFTELRVRDAP